MYCPNCAAPIDGVKFCRSCGSNVSLVPQAMSGQLPQVDDAEGKRRLGRHSHREYWESRSHRMREPSIDRATTSVFSGIGFLLAAMFVCFYFPGGFTWGWAFLFQTTVWGGAGAICLWTLTKVSTIRGSYIDPRRSSKIFNASSSVSRGR